MKSIESQIDTSITNKPIVEDSNENITSWNIDENSFDLCKSSAKFLLEPTLVPSVKKRKSENFSTERIHDFFYEQGNCEVLFE